MATLGIPLDNRDAAFIFEIPLDGSIYSFDFRWNGRMETWKFDLFDSTLDPIVLGVPFNVGIDLLVQLVVPNRPPGVLYALNLKTTDLNPDRFTIGGDVKFYYEEANA